MAVTAEPGVLAGQQPRADVYPPALRDEPGVVEVSILDILLVFARRIRFILLVTFLCTAAGLAIALLRTPLYTAKAVVLPPQQNSPTAGLGAELGSLGALGAFAGGSLGLKNQSDLYVALFKSENVENAVAKEFHFAQQYNTKLLSPLRGVLEKHTKVAADPKSGLINISYEDPDPKRAAAIANAYVEQYRRLSEHLAISEAAQRRLFFEQQLQSSKNELAASEEALLKYQQGNGLVELNSQARSLIEAAANLRAQIAAKQVQIQGIQTFAAPDNASLVQAQGELASLRGQLAKLGGSGEFSGDQLILPGGKVPAASLEYARRLRDVKYNETIFNILARQFEAAKLDEAREGALVQVLDPAVPPEGKSSPRVNLWLAVSAALGFLFSCTWVLLQAALRLLRRDPEIDSKLAALGTALLPALLLRRSRA